MASRRSRPRRFLLPTLLAAVLAAEITGLALARSFEPASPEPVAAAVAAATSTGNQTRSATTAAAAAAATLGKAYRANVTSQASEQRTRSIARVVTPPAIGPASTVHVTKVAKQGVAARSTGGKAGSGGTTSSSSYRGSNRVWIPSLGINKSVQSFPCTRNRPPDAGMYRWGCAGPTSTS
jgi:hypothetical protein